MAFGLHYRSGYGKTKPSLLFGIFMAAIMAILLVVVCFCVVASFEEARVKIDYIITAVFLLLVPMIVSVLVALLLCAKEEWIEWNRLRALNKPT